VNTYSARFSSRQSHLTLYGVKEINYRSRQLAPYGGIFQGMQNLPKLELTPEQRKIAEELGRIGGKTRARKLSASERRAIATKASKAAAKVRTQRAKERKAQKP
jgi:hypothetical protein